MVLLETGTLLTDLTCPTAVLLSSETLFSVAILTKIWLKNVEFHSPYVSVFLLQDLHQMLLNNSTCRHRAPPEEPSPPSSSSSLCCALINHYPASTKWWWMFRFKQLFDKCNNWCAHDGVLSNIWYLLLTDGVLYGGLLSVDHLENLHSILTKTSSTIDWSLTTSSWWFYLKCTPKLCWRTSFVLCNRASPVSQVVPTTDDHKGWKIHLFY